MERFLCLCDAFIKDSENRFGGVGDLERDWVLLPCNLKRNYNILNMYENTFYLIEFIIFRIICCLFVSSDAMIFLQESM